MAVVTYPLIDDVVDKLYMPWTETLQRKWEHFNETQKKIFLIERQKERKEVYTREETKQRLRLLVTHCQLTKLHLRMDALTDAHRNIVQSFEKCATAVENLEILKYMHDILKESVEYTSPEVSRAMQIYKASAGPLAEAHLSILHELLEENGRDVDVLQWLAMRYAEKCDFNTAKKFYRRVRDINEEANREEIILEEYQHRSQDNEMSKEDWLATTNKKTTGKYDVEINEDKRKVASRVNYTFFDSSVFKHESAVSHMYVAPLPGWDAALPFQRANTTSTIDKNRTKFERRRYRSSIPPIINGKIVKKIEED